ncbi:hypothetical protein MBLNU457_1867t1 [Dothideomycetes sp. NU457]
MGDALSSPGGASYDSITMSVGDGTWDSTRNNFLLPNLQGLNFETMQYNGMGNRFRDLPEYHTLIKGHGILAAITFLLVIPAAIVIARFYYSRPRLALKLHIGLNILTVFLATVVLILGWFAVGPERSMTNPHHGIGVALYTLILIQAIGGAMVHRIEKGKVRYKLPLKLMIHQWLGRAIALLGLAQIPLGLTLYGSPKVLFILYALAVALWLFLWFTLSYRYQGVNDIGSDYGYGSHVSRRSGPTATEVTTENQPPRKEGGRWLRDTALVGGALAGLAALRDRTKRRREERLETRDDRTDVEGSNQQYAPDPTRRDRLQGERTHHLPPPGQSRPPSESYIEEEKLSQYRVDERPRHTWKNRLLGAGAGLGAYEGLKRVFYGRDRRDEESDLGSYSAPLGGNQSFSRTDVSRVQAGQAPFSPGGDPRRSHRPSRVQIASPMASPTRPVVPDASRPTLTEASGPSTATPIRPDHQHRRHTSASSFDSQDSYESRPQQRPGLTTGQGVAAGLGTAGGLFGLREWNRRRKERKEDRRLEEIRRMDEENAERINRVNSRRRRSRYSTEQPLTENAYNTAPDDYAMTGSNPALSRRNRPDPNAPPLPAAAAAIPPSTVRPSDSDAIYSPPLPPAQPAYPVGTSAVSIPTGPVESDPSRLMDPSRRDTRPHLGQDAAIGAAGAATGAALAEHHRRRPSRNNTPSTVSGTPQAQNSPVSVKVKIHDDNRHITLRRLNSDEAAAEREARRRERRTRRRRASSLSSGIEDDTPRYRRQGRPPVPNESRPISDVPPIPIQQQYRPSPELNLPPAPTPAPASQAQPPQMQSQAKPPYPVGAGYAPPVPQHSSPHGVGGVTSPATVNSGGGYETGTGTEMSAFDDNRRRRRAERASRLAGQGARVEFT